MVAKKTKPKKEPMPAARLQWVIDQIEEQSPGLTFEGLCVLASETVWCRMFNMTPGKVRLQIITDNLRTESARPEPVSEKNLVKRIYANPRQPFCVSYGAGVDSTALLIWLVRMYNSHPKKRPEYRPDIITFADTGNEKRETYLYLPVMQEYLKRNGFPPIVVVRYKPERVLRGMYHTLEQNCLANKTLPSLAFGFKKCSVKWKLVPQNKYRRKQKVCQDAWAAGRVVIVAIGYDAGPKDAKRRWDITDDDRYTYWYPLVEMGWDRERCIEEIRKEGLPGYETDLGGEWVETGGVPVKSACFFCPSMRPEEVVAYSHTTHGQHYLRAIVRMEANAKPNLKKVEGLWRNGVKGNRGGTAKPGSITKFITDNNLLDKRRKSLPIVGQFEFAGAEECAGCF